MKTRRSILDTVLLAVFTSVCLVADGMGQTRPGEISSVAGILFPRLPRDLTDFDGSAYMASIVVPDELPKLNKEQRSRLKNNLIQLCAIVESLVGKDQTIPTNLPIWRACIEYFPSLKKEEVYREAVSTNAVSLIGLRKGLHVNPD